MVELPRNCGTSLSEQAGRQTIMVLSQMDAGKALTAAAAKGNTSEVQRILEECRVHPDTPNEFSRTALQVRINSSVHVRSINIYRSINSPYFIRWTNIVRPTVSE